jgi:hypothetical protein
VAAGAFFLCFFFIACFWCGVAVSLGFVALGEVDASPDGDLVAAL